MTIFYPSELLRRLLLSLLAFSVSFSPLLAQDLPGARLADNGEPIQVPSSNPPDSTLPDDNSPGGDNNSKKNNNDNSNSQDNGNNSGQGPQVTPTPLNPTGAPNTPLIPQTGNNPATQLNGYSENQPTTTSPVLYTIGAYNLSNIAVNNALVTAYGPGESTGFYSDQGPSFSHPLFERIRLGPFDFKASVTTAVVSDDNLTGGQGSTSTGSGANAQTSGKLSDTVISITPSLVLVYGAHEGQRAFSSLVYSPTINRYLQHTGENNINQNAAFSISYPFQRLVLDASESYTQTTGINQDINARTTQTANVATFGGSYSISDKLQLASHLQDVDTSYDKGGGFGDNIASWNNTFAYQATGKLTIGPSFNFGLEQPEGGSNQTFEQALVTFNYQATDKIVFSGNGGLEVRQFSSDDNNNSFGSQNQGGSSGGSTLNPVFGAGIGYAPFDSTKLSLYAYQNHQASSGSTSQTVDNSGVNLSATQRFLHRFYLGLQFSYTHADYKASGGGNDNNPVVSGTANNNFINSTQPNGSTQENYVYRPSITFAPTLWSSVGIYYQYQDNKSSVPGNGFHDNQAGVSVSAQF